MRELIGRLDVVDDTAASALRVIAHFDGLLGSRVSAVAMVRAAAALAGCTVGAHDARTGRTLLVDSAGRPLDTSLGRQPEATTSGRWSAWVQRDDAPGPLDGLILERLLHALQARDGAGPLESDGAALRMACDADHDVEERRAAVAQLRLAARVTVLAVDGDRPVPGISSTHTTLLDGLRIVLLPVGAVPAGVPDRMMASATVASSELPTGWARARLALRLRVTSPELDVDPDVPLAYESLGSLASLAEAVEPATAAALPDVAQLAATSQEHPWVPRTLHALVGYPSARQAATHLLLHHSTLQERLGWLEERFGYSLRTPGGRHRAALTLALWRISRLGE